MLLLAAKLSKPKPACSIGIAYIGYPLSGAPVQNEGPGIKEQPRRPIRNESAILRESTTDNLPLGSGIIGSVPRPLMFAVGRFDPSAEGGGRPGGNLTKSRDEEKLINHPKKRDTRAGGDGDGADEPEEGSSSAPSSTSDEESSSVPSSDDDDSVHTAEGSEMSALVAEAAPALKVIAPRQAVASAHSRNKRKRDEAADEAVDDFDDDVMDSERRGGDALSRTPDDKAAERAVRLSRLPLEQAARQWNLPRFLVDNLREDSYERFFPIQCMGRYPRLSMSLLALLLHCSYKLLFVSAPYTHSKLIISYTGRYRKRAQLAPPGGEGCLLSLPDRQWQDT